MMETLGPVLRDYMNGRLGLEDAARQLADLWADKDSGGWGLYLDAQQFTPDQLARARSLEIRFHALVALRASERTF